MKRKFVLIPLIMTLLFVLLFSSASAVTVSWGGHTVTYYNYTYINPTPYKAVSQVSYNGFPCVVTAMAKIYYLDIYDVMHSKMASSGDPTFGSTTATVTVSSVYKYENSAYSQTVTHDGYTWSHAYDP